MNEADLSKLAGIEKLPGTLASRVYASLKTAIVQLDLLPGAMLRKVPICEQLGVSRAPVSEAFSRLAAEGLVDVKSQSGTWVARLSLSEIQEAVFVRQALEGAVVAKLAVEWTDQQFSELQRLVRYQKLLMEDDDQTGFYQADERFHEVLVTSTGFGSLLEILETIWTRLKRPRMLALPEPEHLQQTVEEHEKILAAIRNRDPEAAYREMQLHVGRLFQRFEPLRSRHPEYFSTP
jgi:DNA-binding GntR family transcriptional regulator